MDKTRCDSCGMPIQSGVYCQYCVDEQGHLQSFEIRFEKMVQWVLANEPETSREEAEQLTVPKAAVTRNGKDAYVYRTQNKDGKTTAARTPVTVLFNWAGRAIVESDELKNGDKVIVEGNERLMPGATLAQAEED